MKNHCLLLLGFLMFSSTAICSELISYSDQQFDFFFQYPSDWKMKEITLSNETSTDGAIYQIILKRVNRETFIVNVYWCRTEESFEQWFQKNYFFDNESAFKALDNNFQNKHIIWLRKNYDDTLEGVTLVFQNNDYIFEASFFPRTDPDIERVTDIFKSIIQHNTNQNVLPFDLNIFRGYSLPTKFDAFHAASEYENNASNAVLFTEEIMQEVYKNKFKVGATKTGEATTGFQMPLVINPDNYGYRYNCWSSSGEAYHPGVDLNGPGGPDGDEDDDVFAAANGTVRYKSTSTWGGVVLEHVYMGKTWYSQYGHVDQIYVDTDQYVKKGQVIAQVGNIQPSSSAHLHFEIREDCHPNPTYGPAWPSNASQETVEKRYDDPEAFIQSHPWYSNCNLVIGTGTTIFDEVNACFEMGGNNTYSYSASHLTNGYNKHTWWTATTSSPSTDNFGKWNLDFSQSGDYRLEVFVPSANTYACGGSTIIATTQQACYEILHNGITEISSEINQNNYNNEWVTVGTYYFDSGANQHVRLNDNTGETSSLGRSIAFDAIKLVYTTGRLHYEVIGELNESCSR